MASERLDSWKAIAAYLNRDIRTVRRWESSGLPVHRVPGGRGRSVFAFTSEIDGWMKSREVPGPPALPVPPVPPAPAAPPALPPSPTRPALPVRRILAIAAIVMVALAATWRLRSSSIRLDDLRITVTREAIVAADRRSGTSVWRYAFEPAYTPTFSEFANLVHLSYAHDPAAFVATTTRDVHPDLVQGGQLLQFTAAGALARVFEFDDRVTFDQTDYGPPWAITAFAVDDRGPSRRIAIAAHHYHWSASMVTILDDRFQRHGTYWQWGWIERVEWVGRDRLLVAGFDDAKNGGMVALLDASRLDGQAPEPPGTHAYCDTCPRGTPLKLIVMPRSELNVATHSRFNRAILELLPDRVVARTIEVPPVGASEPVVDVLYEFSPDLQLRRAAFGGAYWELHETLRARGQLTHDREHCPDRDGPREILTWDATAGWRRAQINRSR